MGLSEATSLAIESWTLYAIAILTVAARLASRTILLGSVRKWQIDDYIMMVIGFLYTVVIVGVNQTSVNLNNYLPDSFFATITPAEKASAIYGSKWAFATEISKVTMVWLCKACMLILYNHMTTGLPRYHRMVKYVGAYTLLGYLVVIICYLAAWCHPITAYWAVPVSASQTQCASYYDHLINDAVWNISSDLLILFLPLPLLIKAQMPSRRRILLVGIFGLGVLVILCAILNRYYNFTGGFGDLSYLNWYAGETSTAVIVVNVPHLWPLISRLLGLGAFKSTSASALGIDSHRNRFDRSKAGAVTRSQAKEFDHSGYIRSDSEELIVAAAATNAHGGSPWTTTTTTPGKGLGGGDDVEMGHVNNDALYATTVEAGRRRTQDEQEGVWGLHHHASGIVDGQGIVKTVHMNQYAE